MSDEFWTNEELSSRIERLVVSFELIAKSLEGLHEEIKQAGTRYWYKPGPQREVIIGHVPTEEDRIRERQGGNIPIDQWLSNLPEREDEPIGERERQWLKDHPKEVDKVKESDASAETASIRESDSASPEEDKGQA
jgi:hypothetical protein